MTTKNVLLFVLSAISAVAVAQDFWQNRDSVDKTCAGESRQRQLQGVFSPWSPPAWMKTNNDMLHGGSLKKEYYGVWADYYIRFIQEYEKRGINFWD